jgi:hypothetical protein
VSHTYSITHKYISSVQLPHKRCELVVVATVIEQLCNLHNACAHIQDNDYTQISQRGMYVLTTAIRMKAQNLHATIKVICVIHKRSTSRSGRACTSATSKLNYRKKNFQTVGFQSMDVPICPIISTLIPRCSTRLPGATSTVTTPLTGCTHAHNRVEQCSSTARI